MGEIEEAISDFNKSKEEQQISIASVTSKKSKHINFMLEPELYTRLQEYSIKRNIDTSKAIRQILLDTLQKIKSDASV